MASRFKRIVHQCCTRRYAHWRSRSLRYIDTRPNGDALRKCILKGPYTPTIVTTPAVPATEDSPAVPEQTTVETVMNMTPENRAHFESEKEAIHLILTGIGDEIYSTVDACQTAQEMWEAIDRLQQGEYSYSRCQANLILGSLDYSPLTLEKHLVVQSRQQSGIQYFNCKGIWYLLRNAESQKRGKGLHVSQGKRCCCVNKLKRCSNFKAEQSDWIADTGNEEMMMKRWQAHYSYWKRFRRFPIARLSTTLIE
ncbi:hypothetical protein Tco_1310695 [Tanacetum coccineum]